MVKYSFSSSRRQKKIHHVFHKVKKFHFRHQNTILLAASLFFAYSFLNSDSFIPFVSSLGKFSYLSAFILGFFFSFGFTTAPAAAIFFLLADHLNPILMGFVAAWGAMISSVLIFKFVKHRFMDELRYILSHELKLEIYNMEVNLTKSMVKSKTLRMVVPAIAGILTAMPLPTEILVAILWSATRYETKKVMIYSFIFSFLGISALGLIRILF